MIRLICCLLVVVCPALSALDGFFLGVGNELSGNSHLGIVTSLDLALGMDFSRHFSIGAKAAYHTDVNHVTSIEPRLFLRYTLTAGAIRPFIQTETGGVIIFMENDTYSTFSLGLTTGLRANMGRFPYVEPSLRIGYPFLWGAGVTLGLRFDGAGR